MCKTSHVTSHLGTILSHLKVIPPLLDMINSADHTHLQGPPVRPIIMHCPVASSGIVSGGHGDSPRATVKLTVVRVLCVVPSLTVYVN